MEQEKKYLKTIEEVSDALAAGKVMYDKFDVSYQKDKNGFIVYRTEFNEIVRYGFGYPNVNDNLYILEPKPLESKPLEVKLWHLYKNRKGERVLIISLTNSFWIGLNTERKDRQWFNEKGELCSDIKTEKFNLVKEIADLSQYFEKENK